MKFIKLYESFKKSSILSRIKDIDNYNSFREGLKWIMNKKDIKMSDLTDEDFQYLGKYELVEEYKNVHLNNDYIFFLFRKNEYLNYVVVTNNNNKERDLFNKSFEYALVFDFNLINAELDEFKAIRQKDKPKYFGKELDAKNTLIKQDNKDRYISELSDRFNTKDLNSLRMLFQTLPINKTLPVLNATFDLIDVMFTSKVDNTEFDLTDYIRTIYTVKLNNFRSDFIQYGQEENSFNEYDEYDMIAVERDLKELNSVLLDINTKLNKWIKSLDYSSDEFFNQIYVKYLAIERSNQLNYELNQFLMNPSYYNFRNVVYSKNSILTNMKRMNLVLDSVL